MAMGLLVSQRHSWRLMWSAVAERSDDTALDFKKDAATAIQSAVAAALCRRTPNRRKDEEESRPALACRHLLRNDLDPFRQYLGNESFGSRTVAVEAERFANGSNDY
jgi:hypothetical protein